MPADQQNFQVETTTMKVLFVGKYPDYLFEISKTFKNKGFECYFLNTSTQDTHNDTWGSRTLNPSDINNSKNNLYFDYIVYMPTTTEDISIEGWDSQASGKKFALIPKAYSRDTKPLTERGFSIINMDELYSDNSLYEELSPTLKTLMTSAIADMEFVIKGDGLSGISPIHIEDLSRFLEAIFFDPYINNTNIYIHSKQEISLLTLVHKIQSQLPYKTTIKFIPEDRNTETANTNLTTITNKDTSVLNIVTGIDEKHNILSSISNLIDIESNNINSRTKRSQTHTTPITPISTPTNTSTQASIAQTPSIPPTPSTLTQTPTTTHPNTTQSLTQSPSLSSSPPLPPTQTQTQTQTPSSSPPPPPSSPSPSHNQTTSSTFTTTQTSTPKTHTHAPVNSPAQPQSHNALDVTNDTAIYATTTPTRNSGVSASTHSNTSHTPQTHHKPKLRRHKLKPLPKTDKSLDEIIAEVKFVKKKDSKSKLNKIKQIKRNISKKLRNTKLKKILMGTLVVLSLWVVSIALSTALMISTLKQIKDNGLTAHKISDTTIRLLQLSLSYDSINLKIISKLPVVRSNESIRFLSKLSSSSDTAINTLKNLKYTIPKLSAVYEHIFGKKEDKDIKSTLTSLSGDLNQLYENLSILTYSLPQTAPESIPENLRNQYNDILKRIKQSRELVFVAKSFSSIAPEVLGVGDSRKYAILLQNNMELRPTGGFIGSFAILSLDNGKIFDLQIMDVYQADGQLKGHVEPPVPIKKYLGEAGWYLRDSNWDPNFPVATKKIEWFLNKTIKQQVDGVVAVNLNTMKEIINAFGTLHIPNYDEKINADNLFAKAEYYSEINFFPGSTQKKEFLSAITSVLFAKMQDGSENDLMKVLRAIYKSLSSNDIAIFTRFDQTNSILNRLGWDGSIKTPRCPVIERDKECINDYIFVVDANLGVNKANYFIRRKLNIFVDISKDKTITNTIYMSYLNTATSTEWPAGTYKNYQRIYLPRAVDIEAVYIDNKELDINSIDIERTSQKTIIGFLFEVPIKSTTSVKVVYKHRAKIKDDASIYALYWQKQPGTSNDPITVTMEYPIFLFPTVISPKAELLQQSIKFQLTSSQDRRVVVRFK